MHIAGGEFRGRPLKAPAGNKTRPTPARVREALFNMLHVAEDSTLLELYAGSGAIGFEALSRGAASVVAVEQAKPALEAIRHNQQVLGLDAQCHQLIPTSVLRALPKLVRSKQCFDIIFLDPPYKIEEDELHTTMRAASELLQPAGILIWESSKERVSPGVPGLTREDHRCYGDTALHFFERS